MTLRVRARDQNLTELHHIGDLPQVQFQKATEEDHLSAHQKNSVQDLHLCPKLLLLRGRDRGPATVRGQHVRAIHMMSVEDYQQIKEITNQSRLHQQTALQ